MKDITLKKAAVILAVAVIALLAIVGITRNNSGGKPAEETAAKTESASPAEDEAEPAVSDPATASVPEDKGAPKDAENAANPEKAEETGTAKEDTDQSQSASGKENKGNKGNSSGTSTEGKDDAASESVGADSGAVESEGNGVPILELDTVEAEEGQAQDTSGSEPAQTPQDEENETSMMTEF